MRKILLLLLIAVPASAGSFNANIKEILSPENVMRRIADGMERKAKWKRVRGDALEADIDDALADKIREDDLKDEVLRLRHEVAELRGELKEIRSFCLKVKDILRAQNNAR